MLQPFSIKGITRNKVLITSILVSGKSGAANPYRLNPLVETEKGSVTTDRRVCISNTAHIVPSFRCPEAWCLLQLRGQNNSTSTTQPTASGGSTHPSQIPSIPTLKSQHSTEFLEDDEIMTQEH
ncbi:hypothetical protein DAPPUDRAFT_240678 [Daphnia pulex]|uniref:Uncharacterized protein n=1 Tax=Daphnia pulex TaxID=6669 RepID=E9GC84_DAPPU|nr:hypothetical protein DAPPUDRAFT_240678 [Daphnia pulex]|eukprot:EFX82906.1 hypothetical protein DAPPUDRAFT_240678 [Daphnia pulex]